MLFISLVTPTGFEPVISAVTRQRPLQTGPRGEINGERSYRDVHNYNDPKKRDS